MVYRTSASPYGWRQHPSQAGAHEVDAQSEATLLVFWRLVTGKSVSPFDEFGVPNNVPLVCFVMEKKGRRSDETFSKIGDLQDTLFPYDTVNVLQRGLNLLFYSHFFTLGEVKVQLGDWVGGITQKLPQKILKDMFSSCTFSVSAKIQRSSKFPHVFFLSCRKRTRPVIADENSPIKLQDMIHISCVSRKGLNLEFLSARTLAPCLCRIIFPP